MKNTINIELTNICNSNCEVCKYDHLKKEQVRCDVAFAKGVILDAYTNGTREISFGVENESDLKVDLDEFTKYAKGLGFEKVMIIEGKKDKK